MHSSSEYQPNFHLQAGPWSESNGRSYPADCEGVRCFAETHWGRRDHNLSARAKIDHRVACRASITAAMRCASAPRAIFTATPSISNSTALVWERRRRRERLAGATGSLGGEGSITAGTKDGVCVGGSVSPLPAYCLRSSRRQGNGCDGARLCRRDKSPTRQTTRMAQL